MTDPPRPPLDHRRRSWMHSERAIPRVVLRPLRSFLATEAAGGVLLLIATVAALAWANSPWSASYESVWHTELTVGAGSWSIQNDLRHWINDALMALFFFVVGLEIKRELVGGELRDPRAAALPAIAALGGMIGPALIFAAFNTGGPGSAGWGIPMATDIAFAVGVLAVAGSRVPTSLKLFLLALAIVDDIGAIVVIAIFYSDGVAFQALAIAAGLLAAIAGLQRWNVRAMPVVIAILGTGVWLAVFESGVHATVAGVALGLVTTTATRRGAVSPAVRLEERLHPWTSFLIVPLFALANAGVRLSAGTFTAIFTGSVALGIMAGLVFGKIVGISLFSWLATRVGIARLPGGVRWRHLIAVSAVAGIGFTVSLFIAGLAFPAGELLDEAKVAILAGSLIAGVAGALLLRLSPARAESDEQAD